ncbi:bacterioferritin [Roseibacterium elongatum DSM 19469]|uniref:Bacterioferritin n=1 Tax=Roseicyclus elongatus DSM 19469 TaxID=1294273 RepID=W8S3L7_9RHOB|nr:bacterioferritin [Roseibacterium elongatum]AHM04797.1 bacterioferritin [Roseibacterium elongatum DSM 19469]
MPRNQSSLASLQQALSMELTAAQQYLLHAHVLEDWGLDKLAATMRDEMQEELGHAGKFIERILYLGGTPRMVAQKEPVKAESLKEMFETDRADEEEAIEFYSKSAREAFEANDIGSRMLFESIVIDEEGHWGWLDQQLDLLERMGEPTFIQTYFSGVAEG